METLTPNYHLRKQDEDEFYTETINSDNMDIIDGELKKSADHIADTAAHVTAEKQAEWDGKTSHDDFAAHEILKSGSSVLGHVKTDRVDASGNLIFPESKELGRYSNNTNVEDFALNNCVLKNKKFQLGSFYSGETETIDTGGSNQTTATSYIGFILNPSVITKRVFSASLFYPSAVTLPAARLRNKTTGELGPWKLHASYPNASSQPMYYFDANDVSYSGESDVIEIQFQITNTAGVSQYYSSTLHSYLSDVVSYNDLSMTGVSYSTSTRYRIQITFIDEVVSAIEGTVIKTVKPLDLEKWGNFEWKQTLGEGSDIQCDFIKEGTTLNLGYTSTVTGTANLLQGVKLQPLTDLKGLKITPYANALSVIQLLDSNKNVLREYESFNGNTTLASGSAFSIHYPLSAGETYYIVSFEPSSWSCGYVSTAVPTTGDDISITGGVANGVDGTQFRCFRYFAGIKAVLNDVESGIDLSGLSADDYPSLQVRFLLSRDNKNVNSPAVYNTSLTYKRIKKHGVDLIADVETTANAESIIISDIPPVYSRLKVVIQNALSALTAQNLQLSFNSDVTNGNYQTALWDGYGNSAGSSILTAIDCGVGSCMRFGDSLIQCYSEIEIEQGAIKAYKSCRVRSLVDAYLKEGSGFWKNLDNKVTNIKISGSNSASYPIMAGLKVKVYGEY